MDINDTIFNAVKANLENSDINDLLLKICSGTASEEEKEKWNKETELPEEITNKLISSFEKGYKTALEFDNDDDDNDNDKKEIEELKNEVKELNKKVEFIMQKIDMTNYSQFV